MTEFERAKLIFRAWYYFRNGWSLYFAFIFAAINTLTVTYYLAIDKVPFLLNLFPSFVNYVLIISGIGIPILVLIGYVHFKRSPAYKSEATIGFEVNPYVRRNLINSEMNLELNLKILNLILKLSNQEKLSDTELNQIEISRQELVDFVNKRTIKNKDDLQYLKKIMAKE